MNAHHSIYDTRGLKYKKKSPIQEINCIFRVMCRRNSHNICLLHFLFLLSY